MGVITEEQRKVVNQLAEILGKTEQEILNTPYEKIIRLLVEHIEYIRNPHRGCPDCGEDCMGWVSHGERCRRVL